MIMLPSHAGIARACLYRPGPLLDPKSAAIMPSESKRPGPETDRYSYSRAALARLVLSFERRDLAVHAAAGVPTGDEYADPGNLVAEAPHLVELSREILARSVVYERAKGTSWDAIGTALTSPGRPLQERRGRVRAELGRAV
jgi:hypothetical protein